MESLPRDLLKKILARVYFNHYNEIYPLFSGWCGFKVPNYSFLVYPNFPKNRPKSMFHCLVNLSLVCRGWKEYCEELVEKEDNTYFLFKAQFFIYL